MAVNKNPGSRDDNRGANRGPDVDRKPSMDRDSDEYWTGETAGKAKARSRAEEAGKGEPGGRIGHPNRVTGNSGKGS